MKRTAVLCALLALPAAGAPVHAQTGVRWDPDERVLIGDFSHVAGVAADPWRVYAATAAGLIAWDPNRRQWDLPLTGEDGYPVAERPSALAWIASDQQLVLGTRAGTLWRIDAVARRLEPIGTIGDEVLRIVDGEFGTLYVRTPRGWFAVENGAFLRPLAGEPAAARARTDPRLEALAGTLGLDARGRRHAVTAVTAGMRPNQFFAGTAGNGLLAVDARTLTSEPLPYGVGTRGIASIARVGGALWFGGDGSARGSANVTRADTALQRWAWPGRAGDEVPQGFIAAITGHAGSAWFAAGDGLFRHDVASGAWRRYGTAEGLPSERVSALLAHDSVLWVGSARGACLWRQDGCGATLLPGQSVTALSYCHEALWVGTETGLWRIAEASERVRMGRLGSSRIQALACVAADTLYAATATSLYAHRAGQWVGPVELAARGTVRALAAAGGVLWVGGDGGVARWDAAAGQWRYYIAPADVPLAPVWGILPDGAHLWLATPGGALRLDLQGR